jgi:hypothetical protein
VEDKPIVFAKVGVIKELNDFGKQKQPHNNGTSGGQTYHFGQGGCNKRIKMTWKFKEKPHNNGTSGGLAYSFGKGGCNKRNARKINLTLAFTIL